MDATGPVRGWARAHSDAAEIAAGAGLGLVIAVLAAVQGRDSPDVGYRAITLGLAMAVLVVAVLRRRRAQADRAAARAQAERLAIARDLHDVVAHHVSVMGIQAGAVRRALAGGAIADATTALGVIEASSREAVGELRRLLLVLRGDDGPTARLAPPGLAALESLAEELRATGQPVVLEQIGRRPDGLAEGVDVAAFRIVQEALTNARRHAGSGPVTCRVRFVGSRVEIEVTNPVAAGRREAGRGLGLVGMQERVAVFGGTLVAGPDAMGSFRVLATLPYDELTA